MSLESLQMSELEKEFRLIAHSGYPSLGNPALIHFEPEDVKLLGVGCLRAAGPASR